MTTEEVLHQLRYPLRTIPRDAIAAAIARPEEFVPILIGEIETTTELADEWDPDNCLPTFALYLLAQLRESRALEPILKFFALDGNTDENIFGDVITSDGKRILAAVGHDRPERLRAYLLEPGLSPWVRCATWEALIAQVMWGEQPREPLIEFFRGLFESNAFLEDRQLWTLFVASCMDFAPRELLEPIRGIYEREIVDLYMTGDFEEVEMEAAEDPAAHRERYAEMYLPITDTAAAVSWWGSFEKPRPLRKQIGGGRVPLDPTFPRGSFPAGEPIRNEASKIGRNDLCPCGSGKKYKKCCLAAQQ